MRQELLDLVISVAGPVPTSMDLDNSEADILDSAAWFESLPDDLKWLLSDHDPRVKVNNDDDEAEDEDLDVLRKGGGTTGVGNKAGGRTSKDNRKDQAAKPTCDV